MLIIQHTNNSFITALISLIGGALYALAFSSFTEGVHWVSALCAVVLWCCICLFKPTRLNFLLFFICKWSAIHWLWYPLHHMGHMPLVVSYIVTGILITTLAFTSAFVCYSWCRYTSIKLNAIVGLGLLWSFIDFISAYIFHFPWLIFATSQAQSPWISIFSITGTYLGTILIISILSSIIYGVKNYHKFSGKCFLILPTLLIFVIAMTFSLQKHTATSGNLNVTIVQGNIDKVSHEAEISKSLDPLTFASMLNDETLAIYGKLTANAPLSDLYVWPECVVGDTGSPFNQGHVTKIKKYIPKQSSLLLGAILAGKQDINASVLLSNGIQIKHKDHYVPLAEEGYPLWLAKLARHYSLPVSAITHRGEKDITHLKLLIGHKQYNVLPLICFDAAFHVLERNIADTQLIVIQSENIWFNSSWANYQQIMNGQYLSKRYKLPVIYSTNSGISAIYDKQGFAQVTMPEKMHGIRTAQIAL